MDKNELRIHMKKVRADVCNADEKSKLINRALIDFLDKHHFVKIFSYVSMLSEVDTFQLLEYYISKNACEVYVPRTKHNKMELIKLKNMPSRVVDKYGNLAENENVVSYNGKIDVAIVPMLAFNNSCYRLGYGGGYYDKFLYSNSVFSIGIAFDEQYCVDFVSDTWDMPLDIIFTPTREFCSKEKLSFKEGFKIN